MLRQPSAAGGKLTCGNISDNRSRVKNSRYRGLCRSQKNQHSALVHNPLRIKIRPCITCGKQRSTCNFRETIRNLYMLVLRLVKNGHHILSTVFPHVINRGYPIPGAKNDIASLYFFIGAYLMQHGKTLAKPANLPVRSRQGFVANTRFCTPMIRST